ncbi:hypothetical protein ASG52_15890 [Methylobacterium sp. Leaf456]|nr:hypothetical protein ASG52_15890 [Methylobacterium sp. Leaf456]
MRRIGRAGHCLQGIVRQFGGPPLADGSARFIEGCQVLAREQRKPCVPPGRERRKRGTAVVRSLLSHDRHQDQQSELQSRLRQ